MDRNESFGYGATGNPSMAASTLQQDSAVWNDRVGRGFTPQSVLNTTVGSGNGMSPTEYAARTLSNGALLPTGNGEDTATQQGVEKLLLDGKRPVGIL